MNEWIISSMMCRLYLVMVCKREFYVNFLVINTYRFGVILMMDWLNTFHAVIGYCWRSIVFRILDHLKFEFVGGNSSAEPLKYRACPMEEVIVRLDVVSRDSSGARVHRCLQGFLRITSRQSHGVLHLNPS